MSIGYNFLLNRSL